MALLSFVESAPRAYRLKASNAAPPFSTSAGTSAGVRRSTYARGGDAIGQENIEGACGRGLVTCARGTPSCFCGPGKKLKAGAPDFLL